MIIELAQIDARSWRGYKGNGGTLPKRMSWLEPKAAAAFKKMSEACGRRMEFTDVYRSVFYQVQCINGATEAKRRLYAPPTKSGHNFGMSVDVAVDETLENFTRSGVEELIVAGRDVAALGRWMLQFGWSPISRERWHFDFLDGAKTALSRIDAAYGRAMVLDNLGVQRALNAFVGTSLPAALVEDGSLGPKTAHACEVADKILGAGPQHASEVSPWFRRLLAGVTAQIKEVSTS